MMSDGSLGDLKNPRVEHLLPVLEGKVEEIDHMVGEMLETARLEDQSLYLQMGTFDLGGLVREVTRATDGKRDGHHPLALLVGTPPVLVRADRERIAMIVSNLLDNAIKYSPAGGDIDVECRADAAEGVARVVVGDTGLGIAASEMTRLFTRFGRIVTPENAAIPGTGLGLYLARELARMHGGDLTATSVAGRGSAFTLSMPLAQKG
jgi:signal transduction histidine kinase